ncbi:class I SAM-dependent methyltransferase [bacterium]|nr:MAG: class I SAM-dependent methyltransferase [bacterium]
MGQNFKAWDLDEAIGYYEQLRNKPEDIYESERVFFFPLLYKARSVLDVGCAAGGFYNIIRTVNPKIKYTGIDVSEGMVDAAKKVFPGADFRVTSGKKIEFADNSFDLVVSLGVLNHVPDYRSFIKECYRVSKRYCLLDLPRLLPKSYTFNEADSYMVLKDRFHSNKPVEDKETKVPYVLADAAEVFGFLKDDLKPAVVLAKGYFGKCDKSVTMPFDQVCFTVVCIEKGRRKTEIITDLPKEIRWRLKEENIGFTEPFERILK